MNISFITAYNTDVNIGAEYNRLIGMINDDYIFIKDGDCMFLSPDYGDKISKIIDDNKNYDIIGCRTNRLASDEQKTPSMFDVSDINRHIEFSNKLWDEKGTEVADSKCAAAMMMIFKRKVWERIKFKENVLTFDRLFCEEAIMRGFKIGISQGLYVFHLYRWGKENPEIYINHLNKYGKF